MRRRMRRGEREEENGEGGERERGALTLQTTLMPSISSGESCWMTEALLASRSLTGSPAATENIIDIITHSPEAYAINSNVITDLHYIETEIHMI